MLSNVETPGGNKHIILFTLQKLHIISNVWKKDLVKQELPFLYSFILIKADNFYHYKHTHKFKLNYTYSGLSATKVDCYGKLWWR